MPDIFVRSAVAALLAVAFLPSAHAAEPYKIGIIGAGNVGGTLGTVWAKAGDEVFFASRHPDELKDLAARAGHGAKVGTPAEAAAFGDVVIIAVPYKTFAEVAKANDAALKGKVVFDASNAIEQRDGAMANDVNKEGIGKVSASLLPGVHLVRGFNAIHYTDMSEGGKNKEGQQLGIPLASDDPEAIKVASALVLQAGFEPIVVPLARAGEIGPGRPLGSGSFTAAEWKQKLGLAK